MNAPDLTPITVRTVVNVSPARAWTLWTSPEHVCHWNAASDDWHTPRATNDLRVGGRFDYRMEARDGSMGFDFEGTFIQVTRGASVTTMLDDGRKVSVTFAAEGEGTRVTEVFDPESENTRELQQTGWQAILDRFKVYAESL